MFVRIFWNYGWENVPNFSKDDLNIAHKNEKWFRENLPALESKTARFISKAQKNSRPARAPNFYSENRSQIRKQMELLETEILFYNLHIYCSFILWRVKLKKSIHLRWEMDNGNNYQSAGHWYSNFPQPNSNKHANARKAISI